MRAELRLSPAGSGASFAPKTFTFDRPATIEIDGHAPGLDFLPAPASKNAILPSFALVIDQAFVHYDGTSFTLKSVPWHSDSVCVNGKLLGDKVHKLKDGDKLLFGTYLKPGFDIECAVRVHLFFPTPPERAPTTTNWRGVHKLLDGIRKEQAHRRPSRQSDPAPPSSPMPSSSSAPRPASTPTKSYGDVIHELRLRVPAVDSSLVAPSATSSPSPSSLRHSEPPHPHAGPIVSKIPTSVSTSVLVPAPSVPVPSTALTRPPCHSSCESPPIAPDHSGIRDGSGPSIPDSLNLAIDRIHSAWIEARRCLLHVQMEWVNSAGVALERVRMALLQSSAGNSSRRWSSACSPPPRALGLGTTSCYPVPYPCARCPPVPFVPFTKQESTCSPSSSGPTGRASGTTSVALMPPCRSSSSRSPISPSPLSSNCPASTSLSAHLSSLFHHLSTFIIESSSLPASRFLAPRQQSAPIHLL